MSDTPSTPIPTSTLPALTARAAALLLVPPLLWAGNAITGRLVHELISPLTLNFFAGRLRFYYFFLLRTKYCIAIARCGQSGNVLLCWVFWVWGATTVFNTSRYKLLAPSM